MTRVVAPASRACQVLIPFGTPNLYGAERTVIETFDALRPQIAPWFVQAESVVRKRLPVVEELERRSLPFDRLPDGDGWPRIRWRKREGRLPAMTRALLVANWHYARAVKGRDVVYIDGSYAGMFVVAAALRCRLTGKAVIRHFHEWPNRPVGRLLNALVTDYFHNTEAGRDLVTRTNPQTRRKRHWIAPPLIDIDASAQVSRPCSDHPGRHIVFAGQVSLHKGIDLLVDAFGRIAPRHPQAVLHVVGGCREDFLPGFRDACQRSGVADRIRWWGYRHDATAFFRDACLCVQSTPPSRYLESFGRTVVEAMALGVPAVCFGSGALAEIVHDGETGLVCEESAGALAAGIDRLLDDSQLHRRCAVNARSLFAEQFSRDVVLRKWREAFGSISGAQQFVGPGREP